VDVATGRKGKNLLKKSSKLNMENKDKGPKAK
jgi:hypothetical protein